VKIIRNRHGGIGVALLVAALAAPSMGRTAEVQTVTLGNGLVVLLAPDPRATALDVAVWYRAGARYEKPGTTGITYLFGRLMFRGSKEFPSGAHRNLIEAQGGSANSIANPDFMCFYETLPREGLELALRLEADRMSALEITQAKLDTELRAVRGERQRIQGNPLGRGLEELYARAFAGHPYGYPVLGTEQDLDRITLPDVEAYYRERFSPQNAVLTVVGAFDAASAQSLVRRYFERVPKHSGNRFQPTALAAQSEERHGWVPLNAPGSLLLVGWRGPAARDPDSPTLDLISHLLTAGPSSRLSRVLVRSGQPFVGTQGRLDYNREASMLLCMAGVRAGSDSVEAEGTLVAEVEKLVREPVGEDELEPAKRRVEASLLFQSQTARDRAGALGLAQLLQDDFKPASDRIERIRRVTPADLQRVAAKVLRPEARTVVWVGSPSAPAGGGGGQ